MITKDQNEALLAIGNSALKNSNWADYANYCFDREKGLRKEALAYLDKFLNSTEEWTDEMKIEFTKFLFSYFETFEESDYGAFPQPLSNRLVKPTLEKWCKTEKIDAYPFRWYGTHYHNEEYLFKALEIDPADDLARQRILTWWTYEIYYSVHHLPEGYIGDPYDDMKLIDKIKFQIEQLTNPALREKWAKELEEESELVRNYIDWITSGHPDFGQWGKENKKKTAYSINH